MILQYKVQERERRVCKTAAAAAGTGALTQIEAVAVSLPTLYPSSTFNLVTSQPLFSYLPVGVLEILVPRAAIAAPPRAATVRNISLGDLLCS